MDIFNLPLYYISFDRNKEKEKHYKDHGFTNVNHFKAVNGKKMNLTKLLNDGIISIQAYHDITNGRETHQGFPSKGAIGCTLSHYELWQKCVKSNFPAIIIAEEDNRMRERLSDKDIQNINRVLGVKNGVFMSIHKRLKNGELHFFGTHFYIARQDACKNLINNCFPMDVQTDWYMGHMHRISSIHIDGYPISEQNNERGSSIQDVCIKCTLPKSNWFYVSVGGFILVLILLVIVLLVKNRKCKK